MATLALTKLWINLLVNGAAVSAQSDPRRARQHAQTGEVRTYAGGRQRSVTTVGERGVFSFTLVDVSMVTVELLRLWVGQVVQVRDHRGQRFFGVFYTVAPVEEKDPALYSLPLELHVVTTTEGV
jgi:hypothetical protein